MKKDKNMWLISKNDSKISRGNKVKSVLVNLPEMFDIHARVVHFDERFT